MRDGETNEQIDHEAESPCAGPTSVDGELLAEPDEDDDGQYGHDFIDYLNEHFCGFNGS
jgi:hypothetical protein